MTTQIEFHPGESIDKAAIRLCEAANANGEATGTFNEIMLHATAGYAPDAVVTFYHEESKRRSDAWKASPEGKAAERAAHAKRRDLQSKHDWLVARLPKLVMSRPHDVLDWLCEMQEPSDHVGVIVRRRTIIETFEKAGYKANANTGKDYREGDRDNMFEYLVGQALAGLKEGPAIHPIIHQFADDWRKKFPSSVPLTCRQRQTGG